ncbi:sulfite exporter TauE/SafE family protein [Ruminococcaceae bacterium OttesenSCG-928-L11]|nr:sulfite exporter TauE/SafE family protein [Ruminococcaceae bacterium OttesenSCG-928-L11]
MSHSQTPKEGKPLAYGLGIAVGFLNGLFGAGGGMIAVPMLRSLGLAEEEAHATSLSLILPLAILSGFLYLNAGAFAIPDALPYLPGGLIGALLGAWLLPRLKAVWLHRIFGIVILFSAGRLLLQ